MSELRTEPYKNTLSCMREDLLARKTPIIPIADNSLVNPRPPVEEGVAFDQLRVSHELEALRF